MRARRAIGPERLESDRPVHERGHVVADHHHLVADRLHDARVLGDRVLDRLDEALDVRERLLLALLLGEARVAREVGERDRHLDAAQLRVVLEVHLHVADHVLLHEVLEIALVDVVHDRRRQRQQIAGEVLHLLGHLQARDAVAHERLVHVEVEEPRLGVRDLGQRLSIHARELQERDEREAGIEHGRDVAERLHVLRREMVERLCGEPEARPDPRDQSGLEPRLLGDLVERARLAVVREQLLDEPVREPPLLAGAANLLERVPALAQPRHDARMGDRGRGPLRILAVHAGDDAGLRPALERRRRHTCAVGRFLQAQGRVHRLLKLAAGPPWRSRREGAKRPPS